MSSLEREENWKSGEQYKHEKLQERCTGAEKESGEQSSHLFQYFSLCVPTVQKLCMNIFQ